MDNMYYNLSLEQNFHNFMLYIEKDFTLIFQRKLNSSGTHLIFILMKLREKLQQKQQIILRDRFVFWNNKFWFMIFFWKDYSIVSRI